MEKHPVEAGGARKEIPYVDLAAQIRAIKADLMRAAEGVLDRGQFILGPEVEEFEKAFAALGGTRHAVALNSGTDALVLALRALGVGPGHEVITAPNSFVASATAIRLVGAFPRFADVGPDYNLDPAGLEKALRPNTKAVLPVHLTGRPADMDPILAFARRHGLHVVEDCAQAVLAEYRGRRVGSFGAAGCFSLHPLKNLNACGDGGMVTTDDADLAARLKLLRNIGLETRENATVWSGNSRLDTLQAALLLAKLPHAEAWTAARIANARRYRERLEGVRGVRVPADKPWERAVYHTFVIEADDRDGLRRHLAARGIGTAIHYPIPIHLQTAARELGYAAGDFPVSESQAGRILSLPVYPELPGEDLDFVAASIGEYYRR